MAYNNEMDEKLKSRMERVKAEQKLWRAAEKRVFKLIKPVIDKHDIEKLLCMGAPDDEYVAECKEIAKGLVHQCRMSHNVSHVGNLIAFVWHYHFQSWGEPVKYHKRYFEVAEDIVRVMPIDCMCPMCKKRATLPPAPVVRQ